MATARTSKKKSTTRTAKKSTKAKTGTAKKKTTKRTTAKKSTKKKTGTAKKKATKRTTAKKSTKKKTGTAKKKTTARKTAKKSPKKRATKATKSTKKRASTSKKTTTRAKKREFALADEPHRGTRAKHALLEFDVSWYQHQIQLPAHSRGFHLITREIEAGLPELSSIEIGLLHVFILHTSASLTINENADPDVPLDMESSISAIAPEDFPYRHTMEGPDDMPAHVKASLMGSSVTVPVRDGRLCLGTWQGIYLCEHRNRGGGRKLVLTLQGAGRGA